MLWIAPPIYPLDKINRDIMISNPHCYFIPIVAVLMLFAPKNPL